MGGEMFLKLSSEDEAERLKTYLGDVSEIGLEPISGCWLDWPDFREKNTLEVSYSFGGDYYQAAAMLVCREIARRFDVICLGNGAVGWYGDDDWKKTGPRSATARRGPFKSWVEWIKSYDPKSEPDYAWMKDVPSFVEDHNRLEQHVLSEFERLDGIRGEQDGDADQG